MQNGGVVELAREAAAAARRRGAAAAAAAPVPGPGRKFRGVQKRGRRYAATLWNPYVKKAVWLGSYETPVEAAHAYDAAARSVLGRWARPNFPDPASAAAAAGPAAAPPVQPQGRLPLASQAPEPAVAAPQPQGPAIHLAPAPAIPVQRAAAPPILRLFYRPGIGLFAVPFVVPPGAYYVPGLNNASVPNHPVSTALSSAAPVDATSQSGGSAAASGEPERRELPISPATAAVEPVVGDNFTGIDGASSSAARAYVP
ncbi:unnamed protein product [Urochloa decumbens]|uniref:AP2/ERF domain-containing protein n=1 Tax=Urochloa decumbens TaxID=240449 RepID=A0ABC9DI41_9POAL